MTSLSVRAQEMRRFIPLPVLLAIGRRRVKALWKNPEYRAAQQTNMEFLLGNTDRADEIPELAREYAEFDVLRNYRRWRPKHLLKQRVEGTEWLTTKKDPTRGVVVSFTHHGQYDGLAPSLSHAGISIQGVVAPDHWDPNCPPQLKQHYRVCDMAPGVTLVNAADGAENMARLLGEKHILVIASDVAGRTPITFLGREMLGSFGAARLAIQTNSPVVLLTSHQEEDGRPFLRLHEPIEPADFPEPADMLNEMMRGHEAPILAWPAAYDSPYGRLAMPSQKA